MSAFIPVSDVLHVKVNPIPEYMRYVTFNKDSVEKSTECACIYCFNKFKPTEITEWIYDKSAYTNELGYTAQCPFCFSDTVVPNFSYNYNQEKLEEWHQQYYGNGEN